jgi:biopolymer transport protein ExbD
LRPWSIRPIGISFRKQDRSVTLNELNITPLLDLVFVLLVIFIINTPQLVNNLEMPRQRSILFRLNIV